MSFIRWLQNRKKAGNRNSLASARIGRSRRRPSIGYCPRLEVLEDRCLLSGGVLDPTFGTGGVVETIAGSGGVHFALATYPQAGTANDGKIVAAGEARPVNGRSLSEQMAILRYNLNGSLDSSFGSAGQVLGPQGEAHAVAVQPDGKIVSAGYSGTHFAVARYNANGSLDTSFGSRGVATTAITAKGNDAIFALALQADGKIVVAGATAPANSSSYTLALARYNTNGSLDTSFGTGGLALDGLPVLTQLNQNAMGLVIDPGTGQIAVEAPDPNSLLRVVRYTSSGTLDKTFSNVGYETLTNLYSLPAIVIQPSAHQIVVAGATISNGTETLVRLNPDGTVDSNFGGPSGHITNVYAAYGHGSARVQMDGWIVVGTTGGGTMRLTRYSPTDGSLDTTFGTGGVVQVPSTAISSGSALRGMALEPDGRIAVVGYTTKSGATVQYVVARFLATGPQIGSFTASPNPVPSGSSLTLTAGSITDANPGSTITEVAFNEQINGTNSLLGYGTQTSPGVWSLSVTVNLAPGAYTLFAQAEDSYGVFGDPMALTLSV
jgi:uncharacterized delta-60 repeat protein